MDAESLARDPLPDAALRDSEIRYRRLFEAAQDGILLLNAESGQIEDANPFLTAMLGYSHAELLGKKLWDVGAFANVDKSEEMFEQLRQRGDLRYDDLPLKTRGGALINVEFVSNAYDCSGVRLIQCNIRDVTVQKRNAQELERHRHALEALVDSRTQALVLATQAADAANRAKLAFLANMSHEIRTPLGAITGLSHLIGRTVVTPQQADWLAKLNVASAQLLGLINAVLDLSKIESGSLALQSAGVDAEAIAVRVAAMLSERALAKGLSLTLEHHALPRGLQGDAGRLQQALLNCAANAVKFTDTGSVVLRTLCVEDTAHSALLRFEVQDTGPGIAPEVLACLFMPFEQGDNASTRRHGGTGLGLAIVRQLARLMGGQAGAVSTVGEGSRFWFTARLRKLGQAQADPPPPAGSAAASLLARHAGMPVLVVDDEPVNREVTAAILQTVFSQVDLACDGLEAVAMAAQGAYGLILMDMQMPSLDGLAATRQIRMLPGGAGSVIVALTANACADAAAACLAAGMDDFLTKPVAVQTLFDTVLRCLQH